MIQLRHRQPSLWHSGLAKDSEDLWEPWMKEVDQLLEDAALVECVYDAQGKRHPNSRTRGRTQTPAEVALRLLILKHVRNWSYGRILSVGYFPFRTDGLETTFFELLSNLGCGIHTIIGSDQHVMEPLGR